MVSLRHIRAALTAPLIDTLPHLIKAHLAEASSALPGLMPISPETIEAAPDDRFPTLRHELSAHYLALHGVGGHILRSRLEAGVLEDFDRVPEPLPLLSPAGFCDRLTALNLLLTDGKGGWRKGVVRLSDDRAGNRIFFPHVSTVPGQLERLRLLLAGQRSAPPLFTAAVAYALLLNCHPFNDGNGRTARVLFNYLLRRGGMPNDVYLPLYEVARRSHGGYEIALRTVEVRGEWEPFLRYMLNAVDCCRAIATA